MGKYAYLKIEYCIKSQRNRFVNRFCENNFKNIDGAKNRKAMSVSPPPFADYSVTVSSVVPSSVVPSSSGVASATPSS